jgi:hypothetical protein
LERSRLYRNCEFVCEPFPKYLVDGQMSAGHWHASVVGDKGVA